MCSLHHACFPKTFIALSVRKWLLLMLRCLFSYRLHVRKMNFPAINSTMFFAVDFGGHLPEPKRPSPQPQLPDGQSDTRGFSAWAPASWTCTLRCLPLKHTVNWPKLLHRKRAGLVHIFFIAFKVKWTLLNRIFGHLTVQWHLIMYTLKGFIYCIDLGFFAHICLNRGKRGIYLYINIDHIILNCII